MAMIEKTSHGGAVVWFRKGVADSLAETLRCADANGREAARDGLCRSLSVKRMCGLRKLVEVMTYARFRADHLKTAEAVYTEAARMAA
jgi:hypothetical protein